jgi:hypothetical protein
MRIVIIGGAGEGRVAAMQMINAVGLKLVIAESVVSGGKSFATVFDYQFCR